MLLTLAGHGVFGGGVCAASLAELPFDTALRTIQTVEDFSDYVTVASNTYASDIAKAVQLGLVVGKYDRDSTYYDPETPVTTGEMVNILARNLGAATSVQGTAAAAYLGTMGVRVSDQLGSALTVGGLESLASQVASLDIEYRAQLVVVREALAGSLGEKGANITRAFAVAMYAPPASAPTWLDSGPPGVVPPVPTGTASATESSRGRDDSDNRPLFVLTE